MAEETPNQKHMREEHEKAQQLLSWLASDLKDIAASAGEAQFRFTIQKLAQTVHKLLLDMAKEEQDQYETRKGLGY